MQIDRAFGHGVLCSSEEESSDLNSSRVSSHYNAGLRLDRSQVPAEWPWNVLGHRQRFHSHNHVHVLHAILDRVTHEQISLVEKVYNDAPVDSIWHDFYPHHSTILQRMQLSEAYCVPALAERDDLHLYVRVVLRRKLP